MIEAATTIQNSFWWWPSRSLQWPNSFEDIILANKEQHPSGHGEGFAERLRVTSPSCNMVNSYSHRHSLRCSKFRISSHPRRNVSATFTSATLEDFILNLEIKIYQIQRRADLNREQYCNPCGISIHIAALCHWLKLNDSHYQPIRAWQKGNTWIDFFLALWSRLPWVLIAFFIVCMCCDWSKKLLLL